VTAFETLALICFSWDLVSLTLGRTMVTNVPENLFDLFAIMFPFLFYAWFVGCCNLGTPEEIFSPRHWYADGIAPLLADAVVALAADGIVIPGHICLLVKIEGGQKMATRCPAAKKRNR
jgi:hypothetical protein